MGSGTGFLRKGRALPSVGMLRGRRTPTHYPLPTPHYLLFVMRKNFPLRIDAEVLDGVRRWADDDLRSLNGQIEFLLRDALRRAGRLKTANRSENDSSNQYEPE